MMNLLVCFIYIPQHSKVFPGLPSKSFLSYWLNEIIATNNGINQHNPAVVAVAVATGVMKFILLSLKTRQHNGIL